MIVRPRASAQPDRLPPPDAFDVVRKLTKGETPAEAQARVEAEQRDRPARILGLFRRRKGPKKRA